MKNENIQFYCPACGKLEKDESGEPIHPALDYFLTQMLKNSYTASYTENENPQQNQIRRG